MSAKLIVLGDGRPCDLVVGKGVVGAGCPDGLLDADTVLIIEISLQCRGAVLDFIQPILHVPDQGLAAGAGFHVAVGVVSVAAVLDGVAGEGGADTVGRTFVAGHAASFVVTVVLVKGRSQLVGVIVGEALVGLFYPKQKGNGDCVNRHSL